MVLDGQLLVCAPVLFAEYFLVWWFINDLTILPNISPTQQDGWLCCSWLCPQDLLQSLLQSRDSINIHENLWISTCSELLGTRVNAKRNVRHTSCFLSIYGADEVRLAHLNHFQSVRRLSSLVLPNNIYWVSTMCRPNGRCWGCEQDPDPVADGERLVREAGEWENHHDIDK